MRSVYPHTVFYVPCLTKTHTITTCFCVRLVNLPCVCKAITVPSVFSHSKSHACIVQNIVASSASVSTIRHDAVQTSVSRNALVSQRGRSILGTFPYPHICPRCIHAVSLCVFTILGFSLLQCHDQISCLCPALWEESAQLQFHAPDVMEGTPAGLRRENKNHGGHGCRHQHGHALSHTHGYTHIRDA